MNKKEKINLKVKDKLTGKEWFHHNISIEDASWIQINPNLEVVIVEGKDIDELEITKENS